MKDKILSYDLGTGGNKASIYNRDGACLASIFVPYETHYPHIGWHEQRPDDWWGAICESTRQLLHLDVVQSDEIACLGISGHSLGAVPIDSEGNLLRELTPIWSDIRAQNEAEQFFQLIDPDDWYMTTGNGFPPAC
ncbi:MAG: FGGY family carbohydrate kinase, partial [Anaerolineales bacterium]